MASGTFLPAGLYGWLGPTHFPFEMIDDFLRERLSVKKHAKTKEDYERVDAIRDHLAENYCLVIEDQLDGDTSYHLMDWWAFRNLDERLKPGGSVIGLRGRKEDQKNG